MIGTADILRGRILIVDDQAANVLLLERMLQSAGFTSISSTTDPARVVGLHLENRFDLILLDLQMPVVDGFQVMELLKEIEEDGYLPVLVLTAQPDHKLRALNAGAKDFVSKPFDRTELLLRVHNLLEVRLLHAETRRLYQQVKAEQLESERLLLNVLPQAIAERLKGRSKVKEVPATEIVVDHFKEVTVLFADIVGFTRFAGEVSPQTLVQILNDIFTRFDEVADKHELEKIKTIGDAYMAAAGLPVPVPDHAARASRMALDLLEALDQINTSRRLQLQLRVGLDSGPVVAGVIGTRKFCYDLWGETVNTANRLESHGLPGRIQISEATRRLLDETFLVEPRGTIELKGMGELQTWFLNGRCARPAFTGSS